MSLLNVGENYFFNGVTKEVSDQIFSHLKSDSQADLNFEDVNEQEGATITSILRKGLSQAPDVDNEEFFQRLQTANLPAVKLTPSETELLRGGKCGSSRGPRRRILLVGF
jgi:hypothetical protein